MSSSRVKVFISLPTEIAVAIASHTSGRLSRIFMLFWALVKVVPKAVRPFRIVWNHPNIASIDSSFFIENISYSR